jgi:hypothetical protein
LFLAGGLVVLFVGFWTRVLPAPDFDALEVLPSLKVLDAALAALVEVCFLGAFLWDKALPEDAFVLRPVDLFLSVFDALDAAFLPVTFLLGIISILI